MFSDWFQAVPFAKPASIKDTECGAQAPEEDRQIQVHNGFPVPTGQLASLPAKCLFIINSLHASVLV